ncbi:MAG: metal ABC transporter ATP-binding protein [Actinomycetaceae bacterium]|nr:metal ABC transporter ATP-binding protein [Actinomycetaceae bacterium]
MPLSAAQPILVKDLRVDLGGKPILHDISMHLDAGETLALMGANGSGKSTLVKALVRINPVTQGSIEIFGVDISKAGNRVPWNLVGYVPQRVTATGGVPATAREVVEAGLLGAGRLTRRRGDKVKALQALDRVGLAHRANEPVQTFSGGQQQRVLIARALVKDPQLLIMDEPLSGIDSGSREALFKSLLGLHHDGTSIVLVLHELGELAPLIDRAIELGGGHVISDGPPPAPSPGHDHSDHDHEHPHKGSSEPHEHLAPIVRHGALPKNPPTH